MINNQDFCYVTFKGKSRKNAFTNEIARKKLLNIVRKVQNETYFTVHAFCITFDEAHFIIRASKEETEFILNQVRAYFEKLSGLGQYGVGDALKSSCQRYEHMDEEQILQYCRFIHRIPQVKNCAAHFNDYWWSSYNDYIDRHWTGIVNTYTIMNYLDEDYKKAIRKFTIYHRQ